LFISNNQWATHKEKQLSVLLSVRGQVEKHIVGKVTSPVLSAEVFMSFLVLQVVPQSMETPQHHAVLNVAGMANTIKVRSPLGLPN
jgi:hypothetical protein